VGSVSSPSSLLGFIDLDVGDHELVNVEIFNLTIKEAATVITLIQ
jgi:hypothetical protein